jgi:hypothetical protein
VRRGGGKEGGKGEGDVRREISKTGEAGDNRRKIKQPPHERQCGCEESCSVLEKYDIN